MATMHEQQRPPARPRPPKASDLTLCALVCLAGAAVTAVVLMLFIHAERRTVEVAFQLEVDERFSRLQRRFTVQNLKLDSLKRFFLNADDVTEKEFLGFVEPLVEEGETYGWVQRILDKELDSVRATLLLNGMADFSYHEIDPVSGAQRPLSPRPEHEILLYLLKRDDVKILPGMDVLSRPGRQALLYKARDTRRMVVSEPLKMTNGQAGVFFVVPVFADPDAVPANDDGLRGYVIATVRVTILMEQSIPAKSLQRLNVTLSTTDAEQRGEIIYVSQAPAAASSLYSQRLLKVADRDYQLTFRPSQAFLEANEQTLSNYLIALFGGLLTLLMTLIVYLLSTQRMRALALVEQRTRDLQRLNITDHLTGVYNRRHFEESMERLLTEAHADRRALSVIMFDVDHFKRINDQWGHQCGDEVLKALCARIRSATRKTDLLCRTGGEEFTLICPDSAANEALALAQKLRSVVSDSPFEALGKVTCSFGVATWVAPESFDALVRRMDAALYRAKGNGRDCVQMADSQAPGGSKR